MIRTTGNRWCVEASPALAQGNGCESSTDGHGWSSGEPTVIPGSQRLARNNLIIKPECRSLGVTVTNTGNPYTTRELKTTWFIDLLICRVPGIRVDMKR